MPFTNTQTKTKQTVAAATATAAHAATASTATTTDTPGALPEWNNTNSVQKNNCKKPMVNHPTVPMFNHHRSARERRMRMKHTPEQQNKSIHDLHHAARERRKIQSAHKNLHETIHTKTEQLIVHTPTIQKHEHTAPLTIVENNSVTEFIAVAQVVEDIEAQLEQRMGQLREELIQNTVQADTVTIIDDLDTKKKMFCLMGLLLFLLAISGIVGAIVSANSHQSPSLLSGYDITSTLVNVTPTLSPSNSLSPSQSPTDATCTLCIDGSHSLQYPDKRIPRFQLDSSNTYTCSDLAQNAQHLIDTNGGTCDANIQIFANYCGCPGFTSLNASSCNFCPFGLLPLNLTIPFFNDSCTEMNSFVATLSSEQCLFDSIAGIQASAAYCGCPTARQSCSLCPNGDYPTLPDSQSFEGDMLCNELNDYVSILSDEDCTSRQRSMITPNAVHCGCPSMFCSLCPAGLVYDPDLVSLSGDLSCLDLDHLIAQFSADECKEQASLIQSNSIQCACRSPDDVSFNVTTQNNVTLPEILMEGNVTYLGCALCANGMAPPNLALVLPGGGTCGNLANMVREFSPDICALQQFAMEDNAIRCCSHCTLCSDGSMPLTPTRSTSSNTMTCGALERLATSWTWEECALQHDYLMENAVTCACPSA